MEEEKVVKEESNILWGILGFFVPVVGIILFFVWKKEQPKRAKAAIIGFIIHAVLSVVVTIFATIIFVIVVITTGNLESTDELSDYKYTSSYNSYYDSNNTKNNTISTNTTKTNTTNTNTVSTSTTKTNTTSTNTNTINTNTTNTNTSSKSQRVGDDKFGYVTVPTNWYRFVDPNATSTLQYSYANVYIVTLYARDKSELSARDYATSTMYKMKQEGAENVTGATVSLGKYTAYQVYGYYKNENLWLVCWHFEAEDNKTHYISMEGPDPASEHFKIPETFSLKK